MLNDLIASIILFIGAFYLYFFRLDKIQIMSEGSNSLLLPKIILVLLMGFSIILAVKSIVKSVKTDKKTEKKDNRRLILTVLLAIAYLYGIIIFGFYILTPIFIFLLSLILEYKNYKVSIIFSIALTLIVYGLFTKLLYIPLPLGIGIFKNINEILIF